MNDQKVKRLISSEGKTRIFELENGEIIARNGGSASWRNNNPGNLKFEFDGSADRTVHNHRSKAQALARAQKAYEGVVALDQWGNLVFDCYESGRTAKLQLLQRKYGESDVEGLLKRYSTADYSGTTHHRAQADFIYRRGDSADVNLRGKAISRMSAAELAALADGIKGFEGWKVGKTSVSQSGQPGLEVAGKATPPKSPQVGERGDWSDGVTALRMESDPVLQHGRRGSDVFKVQESLAQLGYCGLTSHRLGVDGDFGPNTTHAIKSFQHAHHLHVDGIVGPRTLAALEEAKRYPLLSEATNPHHHLYGQVLAGIHKLPHDAQPQGRALDNAAVALTLSSAESGLKQVDHVVLGRDGVNLFAVQGKLEDPSHRRTHVELAHAAVREMDHRAAAAATAQSIAEQSRTMGPVQQASQRAYAMSGP